MYQNILEKEIRLITSREGQNIPHSFFCFLKAGSEEEAAEKTLELLGEDRWLPPTCILFGDDTMMQGGIKAILQRKLSSSPELPELRDHIREDGDILVHAA